MSTDFSQIRGNWKASLDYLETAFGQAVALAGGKIAEDDAAVLKQSLQALGVDSWDNNRKMYTFGRLPIDPVLSCIKRVQHRKTQTIWC